MNKIIKSSLLCLLAAPCLVACNNGPKAPKIDDVAKKASAQVGIAYGEYSQTGGISLAGCKLITEFDVDDCVFGFNYTIAPIGEYTAEYVKVEEEKLVVEIPTFDELNPSGGAANTYARYKLSAKITYKGAKEGAKELYKANIDKEVLESSWNIRVNAEKVKPVWQKLADARLKENGETVVTSGYVCAFMNNVDSSEYQNGVWLADGDAGMMLYGSALTAYHKSLHIGDLVMVIGTASPYNGLFEVKPTKLALGTDAPQAVAQPVFKEVSENDLANFTAAANCSDPVTVKNVSITSDVDKLTNAEATAISLKVKVGSSDYTYYVNKHTNFNERAQLIELLKANKGKTCTLKTVMGYNSGTFQFSAASLTDNGSICENLIFAA